MIWPSLAFIRAVPAACENSDTLGLSQRTSSRNGKPATERRPQSYTRPDFASRARHASAWTSTCEAAKNQNTLQATAAIRSRTGAMNSPHSGRRRGAGIISDMGGAFEQQFWQLHDHGLCICVNRYQSTHQIGLHRHVGNDRL